jgi:hypothetical protein
VQPELVDDLDFSPHTKGNKESTFQITK